MLHLVGRVRAPEYERWLRQVRALARVDGFDRLNDYYLFNWYGQWDYGSTPAQAYARFIARCL